MERNRKEHEERINAKPEPDFEFTPDQVISAVGSQIAALKKRQTFKESIRVSHEGKEDPFVDAIMDYFDTLEDDNRRIEACYNIIKVCKGIAADLQRESA